MWHYAEDKLWDILLLDIEMGDMDGVLTHKQADKMIEPISALAGIGSVPVY